MFLKDGFFLIMAVAGELKKFGNLVPVHKVSKKTQRCYDAKFLL
jgi:hypothetical protein